MGDLLEDRHWVVKVGDESYDFVLNHTNTGFTLASFSGHRVLYGIGHNLENLRMIEDLLTEYNDYFRNSESVEPMEHVVQKLAERKNPVEEKLTVSKRRITL